MRKKDHGLLKPCNRFILRVSPQASGEAYCPACRSEFTFELTDERSFEPTYETPRLDIV
jgi:phage FluMu protein Com